MAPWLEFAFGFAIGFTVAAFVAARLDAIRVDQIEELREELAAGDAADELPLRGLP